jgi:hypothetical protein
VSAREVALVKRISLCVLLLSGLMCAAALNAQDPTGTIEDQVFDKSGAVMPDASVRVTQVDTGVSHTQLTDASGNFSVPFLPIGPYEMTVEAKGFAADRRGPITLSINERARINARHRRGGKRLAERAYIMTREGNEKT